MTEGKGRKWGKYAEGGEDFETALGNLDVSDDDDCDEVDTGERSEKTDEKKKGKGRGRRPRGRARGPRRQKKRWISSSRNQCTLSSQCR